MIKKDTKIYLENIKRTTGNIELDFLIEYKSHSLSKLLESYSNEMIIKEIIKIKSLTEHLNQIERNEYFDILVKQFVI